ncbi:MAG: hypothetical protein H6733_02670 [Alphaproteobacteria bacterium]|nr:hypothetical protein [Alphaproteobacteria bacterium]
MLTLLVWTGLGLTTTAFAEGAEADAALPPAVEVRKRARRPYPRRLYDDWSLPHACTVEVRLDDKGKPAQVDSVDCPDELQAYTVRRVRRDRWVKPTVPGTVEVVTVDYVPPVLAQDYPAPQYWRRREFGACQLHVAIAPDGAARVVRGEPTCAPDALTDWAPTPERAMPRHAPNVCPVTFLVRDGQVHELDLYLCSLKLWGHVRAGLDGWTWPAGDRQPTPYAVILEFDGPDGRAAD